MAKLYKNFTKLKILRKFGYKLLTATYIVTKITLQINTVNYFKGDFIMARYGCIVCGWIYDEDEGDENLGIAPGTKFDDLAEDFTCPDCGVEKDQFELID